MPRSPALEGLPSERAREELIDARAARELLGVGTPG